MIVRFVQRSPNLSVAPQEKTTHNESFLQRQHLLEAETFLELSERNFSAYIGKKVGPTRNWESEEVKQKQKHK